MSARELIICKKDMKNYRMFYIEKGKYRVPFLMDLVAKQLLLITYCFLEIFLR
jgi:hypothetical protein